MKLSLATGESAPKWTDFAFSIGDKLMETEVVKTASGVTFNSILRFGETGFTFDNIKMISKKTGKTVKVFKPECMIFERDRVGLIYTIEYCGLWPDWYAIAAFLLQEGHMKWVK